MYPYIGGIYEKTDTGAVTKYYHAFGRAVAVRKDGVLSYLLADHLGSTVGAVDAGGTWVGVQSYYPFGATRSTAGFFQTDKMYTGPAARADDDSADAVPGRD